MIRVLFALMTWGLFLAPCEAQTLRIATFHTELSGDGPGLMLRDIHRKTDHAVDVARTIAASDADIIVLQSIDFDLELRGIRALQNLIADYGARFEYLFANPPNRAILLPVDINDDGHLSRPHDTQGYGSFSGQGGIAILSRFRVKTNEVRDFSTLLWRDSIGDKTSCGELFQDAAVWETLRLTGTSLWVVPFDLGDRTLTLLTGHASPPVFDGPENKNGWRNHDETLFWINYLNGLHGPPATTSFVYAGVLNADPYRGQALKGALRALLKDPRLQDPAPKNEAGENATVHWPSTGDMRVSYILPSQDLSVSETGIHSPPSGSSRHRLIWVDIALSQ